MAADFKSHILSRDEKGFGGVPFKRLLLGGISGGFAYTVCRFMMPDLAIPLGVFTALLLIILTALRGGLPWWMRLWLNLRGAILLASHANPAGLMGQLARTLDLPADLVSLRAESVFAPPAALAEVNLSEWVTFARARDLDRGDGLAFVDSPWDADTP